MLKLNIFSPSVCILLSPAVPIDTIYGTLGLLKLDITQQYSDLSKLREELDGDGSYTVFAPSNDAWEQLDVVCIKADSFHLVILFILISPFLSYFIYKCL